VARTDRLVSHDPTWAQQFREEAERLSSVFGEQLVAIHHIGSTAISGMIAKPIIDTLVEVHNIASVDSLNEAMCQLGYTPRGELGIPGRRYFRKGGEEIHTYHVHVFEIGHSEVRRHLGFRDYLIAHPLEAQAYGRLKQMLAVQYRQQTARYTDAKSGFIEEMDRRARSWQSPRSCCQ
jgi:GrpB-like predicted nucleotidyltransferase (UPF0157 family)